jgi:hypothetical protein
MNQTCSGGGWMMTLKGTTGTTFNFSSSHWTTNSLLNAADTTRNNADAKFDTFNNFLATDWLAIFPDFPTGGDIAGGYGGWTWVEINAVNSTTSLLNFYNSSTQITKLSNGVMYTATVPTPRNSPKFQYGIFSTEAGFHWYGYNFRPFDIHLGSRWGFAFNNEANDQSCDAYGGIGFGMDKRSYSAGDFLGCCQDSIGLNRAGRFEWYVR